MARDSDCSRYHLFDMFQSPVSCRRTSDRFSYRRTVMTNTSYPLSNSQVSSDTAPLRAKWGWIVALGVVYLLAGFIALGSVVVATVASVLVVGAMMIIAGVAEVFSAFQIKSWGKFLLWVLLGVLYIIAGFVTFENPLLAAALLTLVLGASLVASGIIRIILAFSMKREMPWVLVLLSAVITLLLGVLILAHWPVSSLYILGLFLGFDLIMAGAPGPPVRALRGGAGFPDFGALAGVEPLYTRPVPRLRSHYGWGGVDRTGLEPAPRELRRNRRTHATPVMTDDKEASMRWLHLAVIILFAAATTIFVAQNLGVVTISFLGSNGRIPLALLVGVVYLLGAATGGSLFALLRRSYDRSRPNVMGPA